MVQKQGGGGEEELEEANWVSSYIPTLRQWGVCGLKRVNGREEQYQPLVIYC